MDDRTIERSIEIDASPETVFEVITSAEHVKQWWPDDAEIDPTPGAIGHLVFGDPTSPDGHVPEITIMEAEPHRRFSFRWVYPDGESAREGNSLLVTFDLEPRGSGTLLRMSETGFRGKDWDLAVLEEQFQDHVAGWDHFLPQLVTYASTVEAAA